MCGYKKLSSFEDAKIYLLFYSKEGKDIPLVETIKEIGRK